MLRWTKALRRQPTRLFILLSQLEAQQRRRATEALQQQNDILTQQIAELTAWRPRNSWMIVTIVVVVAALIGIVVLMMRGR